MLFWVILLITILAITAVIVMKVKGFDFDYHFGIGCTAAIVIGALVIMVLIMAGIIGHCNNSADAYSATMKQRYESLTYQIENNMYDNDNEYGKKVLYDQVQEWNEDLAAGRIMQDNFWIGVFYYHVYDQFDFIQLPERSADDGFSKTCS